MNKTVFTCGDINGIGPEIVIKTLNRSAVNSKDKFVFVCPANIFNKAARIVKPEFDYIISNNINDAAGGVAVLSPGNFKSDTGKPTVHSGRAAFKSIRYAFQLVKDGVCDSIVTAPISKKAIHLAGEKFPGHTEMFAEWSHIKNFVMMFLSAKMNAALFTIHDPIKNIPSLLKKESLLDKLSVVVKSLRIDLGIPWPKIAVLGLNPHAGEDGVIGKEENEIIIPALVYGKYKKYLSGPFSPDAFFASRNFKNFNLVFGMYHDQVLIPFKLINFGRGVNFTAGLPIVRTSPDHGTAFDIAGRGIADESSMLHAYHYAKRIVRNRKRNEQ